MIFPCTGKKLLLKGTTENSGERVLDVRKSNYEPPVVGK
jgi:hypothetical protein